MQNKFPYRPLLLALFVPLGVIAGLGLTDFGAHAQGGVATSSAVRPRYRIDADIDYDLLTLKATADVRVPVSASDPLSDAAFFLYANAEGVGGDDARRKNLAVDTVTLENGSPLRWTLEGAVLHVVLPSPQSAPFGLRISYHGVVPRSAGDDGGLGGLMGGAMTSDISGLLGLDTGQKPAEKPKNTDYGLYTYGNGILSLGSFWYPTLAVREGGKWADDAPEGLGDVAYAVKSDYDVRISAPANVTLVAPGSITKSANGIRATYDVSANDVRDFALLMSEDFVQKSLPVNIDGRTVKVTAILQRKNAGQLDKTLDIAAHALQIYSKRFGDYRFDEFKIVEAPMKNGAGGMEYSRMVGIASMVFGDLGSQLGGLTTSLNLPGADKLLQSLGDGDDGGAATADAGDGGGASNPAMDMVGGLLGEQKEMLDSLLEETVAHEVGHQWWAIGVGSDSVKHPFLDESLTNWSSMLYFEDRYGRTKADKMREVHLKTTFSMGAMLGGGDRAANLPTSAYTNNLQYGAVIYGKGALFYDQLRALVGDAAFFASLRQYYANWNDRIAGPGTLKSIIEAAAPAKKAQIDALYERWINEAHGQDDISGGMNIDLKGLMGNLMGGDLSGLDQ